jgi:hypothetical protein
MASALREGSAKIVHPLHAEHAPSWTIARDLYEGTGGFLDEARPYLVPHPREWLDHSVKDATSGAWTPNPSPSNPSPKLKIRRKLARYENTVAAILDSVAGALFLQAPSRSFGSGKDNEQISTFWADVDGQGKDMTSYMREAWLMSGVFGHTAHLLEKDAEEAQTQADLKLPYLCAYTPLDILDWLEDERGRLVAVKFQELAPLTSFGQREATLNRLRVRIVDDKGWKLYGPNGQKVRGPEGQGDHGFGALPVEYLYARRRLLTRHVGKPVIGDPALHVDLYNLTSEERELLRNQTFAILNVPIGRDGDVNAEMAKMGQQSGTSNVLFSSEKAEFISPSGENVMAYQKHREDLIRMIYRLAAAPWEGDSRDAESAESRRLKRTEQEQVLKSYALEMQRFERATLKLVYRALYGDKSDNQWKVDQPSVTYPTTFQPVDMAAVLDNIASALGLDLGETAMKAMKKQAVRVVLTDLTKEQQQAIDKDIEGQQYKSEDEKRQEQMDAMAQRLAS